MHDKHDTCTSTSITSVGDRFVHAGFYFYTFSLFIDHKRLNLTLISFCKSIGWGNKRVAATLVMLLLLALSFQTLFLGSSAICESRLQFNFDKIVSRIEF